MTSVLFVSLKWTRDREYFTTVQHFSSLSNTAPEPSVIIQKDLDDFLWQVGEENLWDLPVQVRVLN